MVEPFLAQPDVFQHVLHQKFWKDLRKVEDQPYDDPAMLDPTDVMIANDRLLRKTQVTDGIKILVRLFSHLSLFLCSSDCNVEKLTAFKQGRKKLILSCSMSFHQMKGGITFTPVAMLNILIHTVRFMRVSDLILFLFCVFVCRIYGTQYDMSMI